MRQIIADQLRVGNYSSLKGLLPRTPGRSFSALVKRKTRGNGSENYPAVEPGPTHFVVITYAGLL